MGIEKLSQSTREFTKASQVVPDLIGENYVSINARLEFFDSTFPFEREKESYPYQYWVNNFANKYFSLSSKEDSLHSAKTDLYSIALFKIVPFSLKKKIYNKGKWLSTKSFTLRSSEEFSILQALSQDSFMSANHKPTYKFIHTTATHSGFHFSDETFMPSTSKTGLKTPADWSVHHKFISYNHFIAELSTLKELTRYFAKLKKIGAYDNTRIVIVSDHGDWDSQKLMMSLGRQPYRGDFYGNRVNPGMRSALLLVKDFNSRGKIYISSNELMSNGDVVEIILNKIVQVPERNKNGFEDRLNPERVRYYEVGEKRELQTLYEVKGSMYHKDNWNLIFTNDKKH